MIKAIKEEIKEHPFFEGFGDEVLELLSGCGKNVRFKAGEKVATMGQPADHFYLVRSGKLNIKIHVPGRGELTIQTVGNGEILGWSWLFPPYQWMFDVEAQTDSAVIAMDGTCLRKKCDADPKLGYAMMKRFSEVLSRRIQATRLQLLDMYG